MLDYLRVENFAVVEKVELEFSEGLNVLTGETGTGKSILIGAINHFLEKKTAPTALRDPDKKLVVEAMFSHGDDEFVLRREVGAKRSQAFVNGQLVPFMQLREKARGLFNVYGQNEHIFLLNPANHRLYLDEYCDNQTRLDNLAASYQRLKTQISELNRLVKNKDSAAERLDFIEFQIKEIKELDLSEGDEDILEQRLKILSSAEDILAKSNALIEAFYQDDNSIHNVMAQHVGDLDYLREIFPELTPINEEFQRFHLLLPDLSSTLSTIIGHVEYDEDELAQVEDKLAKINRLKKKYKINFQQLLIKLQDLERERDQLSEMEFTIEDKQKEVNHLLEEYTTLNRQLREEREKKSQQLSRLVEKELAKLEMKKPHFQVKFHHQEPDLTNITDSGTDTLEFYFASNPGQTPGRIRDIASGGELSRLMLVLKSILNSDLYATYIFDEIDTGIGGKTAEFVGEKMQRIAQRNQVICISHLPQIASFADAHFLISKNFKKGETFTAVQQLSDDDRVGEIGRLMVGSDVNGDVLKAARSLMEKNRK